MQVLSQATSLLLIKLTLLTLSGCQPKHTQHEAPESEYTAQGFALRSNGITFYDIKGDSIQHFTPTARPTIAITSAAHVYPFIALDALDQVVGLSNPQWIYADTLLSRYEAGEVLDIGSPDQLNVEYLIAQSVNLLLLNSTPVQQQSLAQELSPYGITVINTAEYLEQHPLAQADWIRFYGALTGKKAQADSISQAVRSLYLNALNEAPELNGKVLLNLPFKDVWYVPGPQSHVAQTLQTIGMDYPWSEGEGTGSLSLSTEQVLAEAIDADFWINAGTHQTLSAIAQHENTAEHIKAFQSGQVYNCIGRIKANGANDYWETGLYHPEQVLNDMIGIFSGDTTDLKYFKQLRK